MSFVFLSDVDHGRTIVVPSQAPSAGPVHPGEQGQHMDVMDDSRRVGFVAQAYATLAPWTARRDVSRP